MKLNIRIIYLYLFSAIGLIMVVIALVNTIDLTLRTYVFTEADSSYYPIARLEVSDKKTTISQEEQERIAKEQAHAQKQREVSNAIALVLVGAPLYLYHWKTIQKTKK